MSPLLRMITFKRELAQGLRLCIAELERLGVMRTYDHLAGYEVVVDSKAWSADVARYYERMV